MGASWNYGYGSPVNLHQSADVASTGAQAFTFSPDIAVTAGDLYVAYLSVYGDSGADGATYMPLGTGAPYLDYFVWNNSCCGGGAPQGNPSWNYFFDAGNAQFSATFVTAPEPGTLALLGAGLAGLCGWRLRRRARAA